jgi:hypothetical protein
MSAYTGGCACGVVRYEVGEEPLVGLHCQCRDCQHHSGTGHISALVFPADAVSITGEPRYYESLADSGNRVARGFCPVCGCPLFARNAANPGFLAVTAASLDQPERFKPNLVVFTSSGQLWDHLDPALPAFPRMRPMGPAHI